MADDFLEIRVDTNLLRYRFSEAAQKQIRFAASQAINATAALVRSSERDNLSKRLDKPTPFTLNALVVSKSSKKTLSAVVFMKDRTAWYLDPYEAGGLTKLNPMGGGGEAQLKPEVQKVNQYGNLPRNTTTRLKERKDTFVGAPEGWKNAERGIWKRLPYLKAKNRRRTKKYAATHGKRNYKQRPPVLLIEFTAPHPATQRLNYRDVARKIVRKNFPRQFRLAMARAIKSAKP